MENPTSPTRSGKALLIKKGQIVPENAEPMSDNDIIQIQESRIERFKPQSEMRIFTWGQGTVGATVAISSVIINNIFRQNFKLGGLRRMATYLPVVLVPTFASIIIHDFDIKRRLLLGREDCSLCLSLRSGAYQLGCGVLYPYIISILACVPVAREHYTLPLPVQKSGSGFVNYFRLLHFVSPSRQILLALSVGHVFVGMQMVSREIKVFNKHLRHPPNASDLPSGMRYGK